MEYLHGLRKWMKHYQLIKIDMNLQELNKKYIQLSPEERIAELYNDFKQDNVLFTSSFGISSVFLIHLFHKIKPGQSVHFIDTTYHFKETIDYKNLLIKLFNLKVVNVRPESWKNEYTRFDKTWQSNPDVCCGINKVAPIEQIKVNYDVWVSGLMGFQNKFRSTLNIFELSNGIIKFSPVIDVKEIEMENYVSKYCLPMHPLKAEGYGSVGCVHCTIKSADRSGRWAGFSKTECGLHQHVSVA